MSVRLPDHLDLIAAAPEGIKKLRGLILELAVRGKLVPQDPNDESASELLKRVAKERARLEAEGICRKSRPVPPVRVDERPFEVPPAWQWIRVATLGETQTGTTPSKTQANLFGTDFPFIKPGDISDQGVNYENEGLSAEGATNSGRLATPGSILMVCIGTIGKCNVINRTCSFNQQINSVTPLEGTSHFTFTTMRSSYFQTEAWRRSSSTTIAILNKGNWESIPVPLPPRAEQRRIVAKVDEVMGRLVPQDPNDEPANELLKRIAKERARLEAEVICRKSKPLPPLAEDDKWFVVPERWQWTRFETVADTRLGKMLDKAKNRGDLKPYLRNTNVQWWRFDLGDVNELRLTQDELNEFRLANGDLLICEGGEPGRCAIWRSVGNDMFFQKALHRARPWNGVLPEYLQIVLRQDAAAGRLERYFTGATIKHFSGEKLAAYAVPLPPTAEQHRIVAKVDELMTLCDRLKADLAESRARQKHLSATLIESALQAA